MARNGVYRCGAGVNHHERESVVERWRRADQQRVAGQVADKVRAHDDYMDAIALFRARNPVEKGFEDASDWNRGYTQAKRDLERALVDVLRHRQDQEATT